MNSTHAAKESYLDLTMRRGATALLFKTVNGSRPAKENAMRKREVIEPRKGSKRYVRRDAQGQFTESQVNAGRSLAADRRSKSKTVAPKGQGDRGDQKKS